MSAQHRPHAIATHVVSLSMQTASQVISRLTKLETDPDGRLRAYKLDCSSYSKDSSQLSAGLTELFNWLNAEGRKVEWEKWVRDIIDGSAGSAAAAATVGGRGDHHCPPRLPIRTFEVWGLDIWSSGYNALTRWIHRHGSLTKLDLYGAVLRTIPDLKTLVQRIPDLKTLSLSINESLLRVVNLSDVKVSADGLINFLDNLHAPCLHDLKLNNTLDTSTIPLENSIRFSVSVAKLLRSSIILRAWQKEAAEPPSSTSPGQGGWAPQLEWLSLNGVAFSQRGIAIIVGAVVGSPTCPPNRALHYLRLTPSAALDLDDVNRANERPRQEPAQGRGSSSARQSDQSLTQTVRPRDDWPLPPDDPRCYSHVTPDNWAKLLSLQLWENGEDRRSVNVAALRLLPKVRILGCRSRPASTPHTAAATTRPAPHFTTLPAELQLQVLRVLDDKQALSEAQFQRVVQWACDPSTIGYGGPNWRPPTSLCASSSRPAAYNERDDHSRHYGGHAPTHPWPWASMIRSGASIPRDWEAEAWDERMAMRNMQWLMGTANGVEHIDQVGNAQRSQPSNKVLQAWSQVADGAMLAFLEATGTNLPESRAR